jgi:hypothetical protein
MQDETNVVLIQLSHFFLLIFTFFFCFHIFLLSFYIFFQSSVYRKYYIINIIKNVFLKLCLLLRNIFLKIGNLVMKIFNYAMFSPLKVENLCKGWACGQHLFQARRHCRFFKIIILIMKNHAKLKKQHLIKFGLQF